MKAKRFGFKLMVILGVVVGLVGFLMNREATKEIRQEIKISEQLEDKVREIDQAKLLREDRIQKSKMFIDSFNTNTEIKCYNFESTYRATFDDVNKNKFTEFLADQKLTLQLEYHASIDFPTNKIQFNVDSEGNLLMNYDKEFMKCGGISIDKYSYTEDNHLFGAKRTKTELLTFIETASDSIIKSINSNQDMQIEANRGLESYIKDMARKFGVKRIIINNSYVETLNVEAQQVF